MTPKRGRPRKPEESKTTTRAFSLYPEQLAKIERWRLGLGTDSSSEALRDIIDEAEEAWAGK